ncbi:MAG TPA: hypothetical protein VGB50_12265 [Flavobacterium sp.]|jgi:hypothetical protein
MKTTLLFLLLLVSLSTAAQPPSIALCDTGNDGIELFNLTSQNGYFLDLVPEGDGDFVVTYYQSQADADANINPIANASAFTGTSGQNIYGKIENLNSEWNLVAPFELILHPMPVVMELNDVNYCISYELPQLPSAQYYYTAPNGAGTMVASGDVITQSCTLYIFAVNGICSDESSFDITISGVPQPVLYDGTFCIDPVTEAVVAPYILDSGYSGSEYTFQWTLDACQLREQRLLHIPQHIRELTA